jgi:hypothetical protein
MTEDDHRARIAELEWALRAFLVTASATSRKSTLYELLVDREDYDRAFRVLGLSPPPHPWEKE